MSRLFLVYAIGALLTAWVAAGVMLKHAGRLKSSDEAACVVVALLWPLVWPYVVMSAWVHTIRRKIRGKDLDR